MASGGLKRLVINHDVVEAIEDSYADRCKARADSIAATATSMAQASNPNCAPYRCEMKHGTKGGRRYASVFAAAPSTLADNARNNTLLKAGG